MEPMAEGAAATRRRRRRSHARTRLGVDERREQLLQIGAELFSERAYEDVWIDEIAEAAERGGIPLGAFGLADPRVRYDAVATDLGLLRKALADAA